MVHSQDLTSIRWENAGCPICGQSRPVVLLECYSQPFARTFQLVRCYDCGMGYTNPRPQVTDLAQLYPAHYAAYRGCPSMKIGWCKRQRMRLEKWSAYVSVHGRKKWLRRLAQLLFHSIAPRSDTLLSFAMEGEGRLLDFGCGVGEYASKMQQRGWQVDGIDLSNHAAQKAQQLYGFSVWVGSLPHPNVKPQSYDMITMGQVLEHIPNPHQIISSALEALKPNGRLVISVPNLESWGRQAFGKYWWPLQMPWHVLHFTPSALTALMRMHGFAIESIQMMKPTHWFGRSWQAGQADGWKKQTPPIMPILGRWRWVQSVFTRWLAWTKQADGILLIARRPKSVQPSLKHWPVRENSPQIYQASSPVSFHSKARARLPAF